MGNRKNAICTILLIIINIVVFLKLSFGGMTEDGIYMLEHGAMYVPFVTEHQEYYRLGSSLFLHFGFDHLVNNMLTLGIVGIHLEPVVGKMRFLLIYFISGFGGNLISMLLELRAESYAISAGASGAIFGLTGALLCLAFLNPGKLEHISKQGMLFMVGLNLYNGFVNEGVDNAAHVGGLFFGIMVTALVCGKCYKESSADTDFGRY